MAKTSSYLKEGKVITCLNARYRSCHVWNVRRLQNSEKEKRGGKKKKNPAPGLVLPELKY